MKIKRLLSWLLVFVLCFALCACKDASQDQSSTSQEAKPLLYRVTDEDGHVLWLFGSIHVGREDYYPLPEYVMNAFDGADSLAVEADIIAFEEDVNLQMETLMPLMYMDGSSIKDHIPQELYDQAVEAFEGFDTYMSALDLYCPAFWSSMLESLLIEQLGADIYLGIDRHLLEKAKENQKPILEIESAAFQYQMLAGFSDELQTFMLENSVQMCQNQAAAWMDLNLMMDLWASGDEQNFATYLAGSDENMTDEEKALYEEYNQALLTDRNLQMAEFARDALLSGDEVFICVGAAHVIGEGSLSQLMAQWGYTVEQVVAE